jgi:LPXTG-motif cell wall-anchored protein
LELSVFLTRGRRIAVGGHQRSVAAMTKAALAKHTGEKMDTTTLLVIVLVVLLLGGGGFFYRRRV